MYTQLDVELANIFYPMLVELAVVKKTDTYQNLRDRARERHPDNPYVQGCHHRHVARRLNVVTAFTDRMGYPVLAGLVVNGSTGKPGMAFEGDFETLRDKAYAFDWSTAETHFSAEIEQLKKEIVARAAPARRDRKTALDMMSAHYQTHKADYNLDIKACREALLDLLMKGEDVEDAFEIAAAQYRKKT
jgi:hypothetical protein